MENRVHFSYASADVALVPPCEACILFIAACHRAHRARMFHTKSHLTAGFTYYCLPDMADSKRATGSPSHSHQESSSPQNHSLQGEPRLEAAGAASRKIPASLL